jgi:hypothetical protein
MTQSTVADEALQRIGQLCQLLQQGRDEQATVELPGLDSTLLNEISAPLTELTLNIRGTGSGGDMNLLLALRKLQLTAEHTQNLLQTVPALAVSGPHIRLHPDSILSRAIALRDLIAELPGLQELLPSVLQGSAADRLRATEHLQQSLTGLNARLTSL